MSKKVDWGNIYSNPVQRNLGGSRNSEPKYSSGRDRMQKAFEEQKQHEEAQEMLQKAMPAMSALLKCRLQSKTPLKVMRPLVYASSEMVTTYGQKPDPETGWLVDDLDDPRNSKFQDVQKAVNPGTELILKSLDPNMQEFVFEDQNGEEIALPYSSQTQLMTSTNIYEDVKQFMENKGE